ncbi:Clavaminate synthase-like protein [Tothia fuscella]|uniref:Clavaminate synthase-like protein n=1 Tax=Tothia fuscella TaxID=1048955 RepID=A0A9P4P185_9PEZI|nr:Clavaminate synthase-like protein [Tothia fuscella]
MFRSKNYILNSDYIQPLAPEGYNPKTDGSPMLNDQENAPYTLISIQEFIHYQLNQFSPFHDPIGQCGPAVMSILTRRPDEVLDMAYQKINAFKFSDVPRCWLRLYTDASLWKICKMNGEGDWIQQVVYTLDMAIIIAGSVMREEIFRRVFEALQVAIETDDGVSKPVEKASDQGEDAVRDSNGRGTTRAAKRRKRMVESSPSRSPPPSEDYSNIPTSYHGKTIKHPKLVNPIYVLDNPDLGQFLEAIHEPHSKIKEDGSRPWKITNSLQFWPAMDPTSDRCWKSPQYLLKKTSGGRRIVPVELGKNYTDDSWGQKIMTVRDFMEKYMLEAKEKKIVTWEPRLNRSEKKQQKDPTQPLASDNQVKDGFPRIIPLPSKPDEVHKDPVANIPINPDPSIPAGKNNKPIKRRPNIPRPPSPTPSKLAEPEPIGYLAQYDLFAQIPELRNDIAIPDFCYTKPPEPSFGRNTPTLEKKIALAKMELEAMKENIRRQKDELAKINVKLEQAPVMSEKAKGKQRAITPPPVDSKAVTPTEAIMPSVFADTSSNAGSDATEEDPPDVKLNAWYGPAGTTSPLHTDPHHNILTQVVGKKYIRLYAPSQTPYLYPKYNVDPHTGADMSNTSMVDMTLAMGLEGRFFEGDVNEWDVDEYRDKFEEDFAWFRSAEFVECVLEEGEAVFIPKGWWHFVRSLSVSFSVSFWWD